MAAATNQVFSHVKDNRHIYTDPRNIITLALWAGILGTHGFLIFVLGKELYKDIVKPHQ
ncbi:MAG: hypothetical protein NVS2B12_26410 [Ktedonobacteraceae bacterium]